MTNTGSLRLLISDDHTVVRHALSTIIGTSNKYQIVAEASDFESTTRLLSTEAIDILVLDLGLPDRSGFEVLSYISEHSINTQVLVLSMYEDDTRVQQALLGGAKGYLLKDATPQEILRALDAIANGDIFLQKRFEHIINALDDLKKVSPGDCAQHHPLYKLSKREREVFYLLVDGKPNRIIAKQLFLSPRTVETHRARLIKKLGLISTADLVLYAIKNSLLNV